MERRPSLQRLTYSDPSEDGVAARDGPWARARLPAGYEPEGRGNFAAAAHVGSMT